MFKRYEVQGPFKRKNQPQYWVVFDKVGKCIVGRQYPRSGDAWTKMTELEEQEQATTTGG